MGFAREEAAVLSKDLTTLAIDVASFNNKLDAEVLRDFQSALVGNTETVRKYGIVITATQVEQDILNRGWVTSKSEITEAMKVQARYNMIVAGSTDAIGDAERTSGSFANTMKGLKASIQETAVMIGQKLLPLLSRIIGRVSSVVKWFSNWISNNAGLTKTIVFLVGAVGGLMLVIGPLLIALPSLVTGFTILRTFLLTKMIPAIVATVTALWAKVTALLAVLAAAGPVGWAVLAGAIALIGTVAVTGAIAVNNLMKNLQATTEATEEVTESLDLLGVGGISLENLNISLKESIDSVNMCLEEQVRLLDLLKTLVSVYVQSIPALSAAQQTEWLNFLRIQTRKAAGLEAFQYGGISHGGLAMVGESGPEVVALPPGASVTPVNQTTYNVDAHYTSPQDPASIALDLEALALTAGK